MGNCVSPQDREAQLRSQEIDKQIEEDSRKLKKECKILLLGSGESGKSTIVKQMKIIHQNGYTRDELLVFRIVVWKNLIDSAQAILLAMRKIGVDPVDPANRVSRNHPPSPSPSLCCRRLDSSNASGGRPHIARFRQAVLAQCFACLRERQKWEKGRHVAQPRRRRPASPRRSSRTPRTTRR